MLEALTTAIDELQIPLDRHALREAFAQRDRPSPGARSPTSSGEPAAVEPAVPTLGPDPAHEPNASAFPAASAISR